MIVVEAPPIQFKCNHCGATCQGQPEEFVPLYTMPPTWRTQCGFCRGLVTCSPTPLIARAAAEHLGL